MIGMLKHYQANLQDETHSNKMNIFFVASFFTRVGHFHNKKLNL